MDKVQVVIDLIFIGIWLGVGFQLGTAFLEWIELTFNWIVKKIFSVKDQKD